jgi:uncharacterized membrane protein
MKQTTVEKRIPQGLGGTSKTYELTLAALFIALTYVATAFINIKIPFLASNGGLIHLGNIPLFVAAALYGKKTGALAGAFGMGLFDLTSGWVSWAPFTFVICGLIGFVFGVIAGKGASKVRLVLAVFAAAVVKVAGYYVAEIILYGSFVAPLTSIPGNLVQIFAAGIVSVPLVLVLKKALRIQ